MPDGKTITCAIIEQDQRSLCGVCEGHPGPDGCQCDGSGRLPFPPMPYCATDDCDSGSMTYAGNSEQDKSGMPIYRCGNGHYTAVKFRPGTGDGDV